MPSFFFGAAGAAGAPGAAGAAPGAGAAAGAGPFALAGSRALRLAQQVRDRRRRGLINLGQPGDRDLHGELARHHEGRRRRGGHRRGGRREDGENAVAATAATPAAARSLAGAPADLGQMAATPHEGHEHAQMQRGRQQQLAQTRARLHLPAEGHGERNLTRPLAGHIHFTLRPSSGWCSAAGYDAAAAAASGGARPNTFTPAPRATSIAWITSENRRLLSALMNRSLSARTS